MNKLNELIISGTVGSLVTLAVLASPLFAQNKTPIPTPSSSAPVQRVEQHQMMQNMAEMMEKCKAKMASHKNQPAGSQHNQHNQHHPNNTNPAEK